MANEENNEITLHPDRNEETNKRLLEMTAECMDNAIDRLEHGLDLLKSARRCIGEIIHWNKLNKNQD
ncbi:MAG: hypothetical protein OXH65_03285 [Paracoccaceae bacterium]|nr:hypothetical protein [Paracoccaceae bacterium]MDE2674113.1 hypothetical protein [Paracoccaceae bacterium]